MVNLSILQMAQAASQNKEILGHNREYCSYTNQYGNCHICLVTIVQHDKELKRSIHEVLQIFSISFTDKIPYGLLEKIIFNDF